jgi:P4 family phage/plasmid primase-like protien
MTANDSAASQEAKVVSCLEVALDYINSGLVMTPVLSPKSGKKDAGKAAYLDSWQERKLNAEAFEAHFRKGSNIGLVTGADSGIVCIDLDGRDGIAWYFEHKDNIGDCIVERRGENGIHLYFNHPGPEVYIPSKIKLFPGVDILADGGKQVVTWPSMHRSGDQYKIDNGLTLLDVKHEADNFPTWILNELSTKVAMKETAIEPVPGTVIADEPSEIQRCIEAINALPPAIEGQGGDNNTFIAAATCKNFGLSRPMALKVLKENYNPRCQPPWDNAGLEEKVNNGYKHSKDPFGSKTHRAQVASMFPDVPDLPDGFEDEEEPREPVYVPKYPVVCAQTYINRNPRKTLCSKGQLHTYVERERCWELISDDQFKSLIMYDVERANPVIHKGLKMTQVNETSTAVKRILESNNPNRDLVVDSWITGRTGEFISCANGILDIATGELFPHSSDWFSFTTLPFDYDRTAQCKEFEAFLDSIWEGDEELKESLRLWMGYLLISSMKEQKFALLKGASRAGKGTLARVIEGLIGHKNYAACSMNSFGGDFGLEPVLGKRLAIFNDAEKCSGDKGHIATERLKSITGNDSIPINRKGTSILTVRLPCKIVFVCNKIPPFMNDENAMTNRMIGFPFEKSFMGREDVHLEDKLKAELPGILNWALKGSRAIMTGARLVQSKAGAAMIEEIGASLDPVKCFIRDCVKFTGNSEHRVMSDTIWPIFKAWCAQGNTWTGNMQSFQTRFRSAIGNSAEKLRYPKAGYAGILISSEGFFEHDNASEVEQEEPPF